MDINTMRASDHARHLPIAPSASLMWVRLLIVATVVLVWLMLDWASELLVNKWLLDSMGYSEVFWTNFGMQATLFFACFILSVVAIGAPAFLHGLSARARLLGVWIASLAGALIGYFLSFEFYDFLGPLHAMPFDEVDPLFGNDISFYVFDLPPIRTTLLISVIIAVAGLLSSICTAFAGSRNLPRPEGMNGLAYWLARVGTPLTCVMLMLSGIILALMIWLRRYGLLTVENFEDSTEQTGAGAEYVDVVGFFSTKNSIYVEALAILALAIGLTVTMIKARRAVRDPNSVNLATAFGPMAFALVLLPGITTDLVFRGIVAVRDQVFVVPNEPVIQLPFLQRHIDATNRAYGLDDVEEVTFRPPSGDDPLPPLRAFLDSPTIRNAPLWSGHVSRYSRRVVPHYIERILLAEGDMTIFSPTLQILEAQEALRPYYGFMDVDTIAAEVDGQLSMFAAATRELPQDIVRPWLIAWGQRAFLFTHGHGLITMSATQRTDAGDPIYGTSGIPVAAALDEFAVENAALYYGEGAVNAAFSGAVGVSEHDFATEQGREELQVSQDVEAGFEVNSVLKRLVVGYESGDFFNVVFSGLIDEDTHVHIYRRPIERIEQLAPFLALDTDPFAFPTADGIMWMVNAVSYSDAYPYSARTLFGDPSDLRTEWRYLEPVNYVADAVKAVINGRTGHVDLYLWNDEPVINTWAAIYPTLFKSRETMPEAVRSYVQYPHELMAIQFNLVYPFYHQRDALTFYSGEDLMDDADEVVGEILGTRGATISFSQDIYHWIVDTGGAMPEAETPVQFAISKSFTPQDPLNLRAIATAYMTGEDYGRLSVLKIPKGLFFMGPEQADAAIDQNPYIAQEIGLWNRLGVEVIRGRTATLLVEGEILYVEPIFIRSRQNPVPQLQRVIVVLRGEAHMGRTIEEALTFAIAGGRLDSPMDTRSTALME